MTDDNDKAPRDMTDEELQDESAWDFESAEQLPSPERKARAVVSVAFPGNVFDYVAQAADRAGMKISHFIRDAAIEKAATAAPTLYWDALPTETKNLQSVTMTLQSAEENMALSAQ